MTRVVFDTTLLADALKRASRVAPLNGEAFEKAAGIMFQIQPDSVVIKATDLTTYFSTWLEPQEVDGKPIRWRVSSRILPDVISKLRTMRNSQTTLEDDGRQLKMTHGTIRAAFGLMNPLKYPDWVPFGVEDMHMIEGLTSVAERVGRTASRTAEPPLTGVHFDGESCVATDRYRMARMPLALQIKTPGTIPAGTLEALLPKAGTVWYRAEGTQLHLMPDRKTQISITMYGGGYPPVQQMMRRDYPQMVRVNRAELMDAMTVANSMTSKDAVMHLFLGAGEVAVFMANQGEGHIGNTLKVPGQAAHPRIERMFNPAYLMSIVENSITSEIMIGYDPAQVKVPIYVDGGGIEHWAMPLSPDVVAAMREGS